MRETALSNTTMKLAIAIIAVSPIFGQAPKPVTDLVGTYRGTWTMYGLDEKGTPVKRASWTDVMTAAAPTVADGKAFVSTIDEMSFEDARIPPTTIKGREGWLLAPDGKMLQDYFIESNGQIQRLSKLGQNVWMNTAVAQPREFSQLGISGVVSAQHTMVKVVTEEDGVETHHISRISTVHWKDAAGKDRWTQYVSLEGTHRRQ
jgi:hypothetical protein